VKIYSVYDNQAERYTPLICLPANNAAIRSFSDAINGGDKQMSAHPADFSLFEVGTWLDDNGELQLLQGGPKRLVGGLDVKTPS